MEQDKREKELMNTAQTSESHGASADVGGPGSPRIGTSNHRQSSSQAGPAEQEEARQPSVADSLIQSSRSGRVIPNASQTRRSNATVPQHPPPCGRSNSRLNGPVEAPISTRRPVPPSARQGTSRHGANSHAASIPARRLDDSQQATTSISHAGQAGQLSSTRAHDGSHVSLNLSVQEPAVRRQAGPANKASVRPIEATSRNVSDQASGRQSQGAGHKEEYIATGEVVGVPVHTRSEYTMAATSRTSSVDLHAVPKVEHVSHVKLSTSSGGMPPIM